jgi:protein O-GlcNAc transferase
MLLELLKRIHRVTLRSRAGTQEDAARAKHHIALGQYALAGDHLAAAARREPQNPAWPSAEADCRARAGDMPAAVRCLRTAIALVPADAKLWTKLGYALWEQALVDEAIVAYRNAIECDPRTEPAGGNLLFALLHRLESPAEYLRDAKRWASFARPQPSPPVALKNAAVAERRLRVGYVSADLRTHAISPFIESLLAFHDKERFELLCYDGTAEPDRVSAKLREHGVLWRPIVKLEDNAFASLVRDDGVDILVDLSGHTGGNRLRAFAWRLAPLQLCGHGYPATTGLECFDWRLTDALNDPPGAEAYYTERLYRLPAFCCSYRPASAKPVPRETAQPFTFGSLNNVRKITPRMVTLWSRLLQQVPGARLLIAGTPPGTSRERIAAGLASTGVALQRVDFESWMPRAQYAALHGRIDVALDTYPYNGSTTTFEALWHGVPVITLSGPTLVNRLGRATLEALGESPFWTENEDRYLALAVELAGRAAELPALRCSMHERMRRSPILDERGYLARVEEAYRDMWRQWCLGAPLP